MNNVTLTCRTCGDMYPLGAGEQVRQCPSCGTVNCRPQAEGTAQESLLRAVKQRLWCDFVNAERSYQHVLLDHPEEHEALWGLAMCRYGVEHVEDPKTGRRLPVVHTVRRKPMQLDSDFRQACEFAPEAIRAQYEAEAEYIDAAMSRIRELANACPSYDVFLCHKTTRPGSSEYTEDYTRAFKLYHMLDKQGYRVFFAPMEMEGVAAGSDYEAAIYHALDTSRVMLVVCSEEENLLSPWVRSEWSRFLEMTDEQDDRIMIPLLYGDMSASRLPREFRIRKLQAVVMGEMGSAEKVAETIRRYVPVKPAAVRPVPPVSAPVETPVQSVAHVNLPPEEPVMPPVSAPAMPGMPVRMAVSPIPEVPFRAVAHASDAAKEPPAPDFDWDPEEYSPEAYFVTQESRGACVVIQYTGDETEVRIPPVIRRRIVVAVAGRKSLDGSRFSGFPQQLVSVELPPTIQEIGVASFQNCRNLQQITIPESVTAIWDAAFRGCTALRSVTVEGAMKQVGQSAFEGCTSLESIDFPPGLESIAANAFLGCHSLRHAVLPEGLTAIREAAFCQCRALEEIRLPDSLTTLGQRAFGGCLSLKDVVLSRGLRSLLANVFSTCRALSAIEIPEGVAEIGDGAFASCSALERVRIPGSVTIIGSAAFASCSALESIVIPEGVRDICQGAFHDCSSLTNVTLPAGVKLGRDVFAGCPWKPRRRVFGLF